VDVMNGKRAWAPAEGPPVAPEQVPGRSGRGPGSGAGDRAQGLWAPSEGPTSQGPGGPGGDPDGETTPRRGRTALDEP